MLAPEVAHRIVTRLPSQLEAPHFALVGVGGAGLNVLRRVADEENLRKLAVDRDAYRLALCGVPDQVELGPSPDVWQEALRNGGELDARLEGDILIIVAGLGRRTGTEGAPALAARARERGLPVLAFLIWPFQEEGIAERATQALTALRSACDALMILDNDAALDVEGEASHWEAAHLVNRMVGRMVERLVSRIAEAFPFSLRDEISDFVEGLHAANTNTPLRPGRLQPPDLPRPIPVDAHGWIQLR